MTDNQWQKDHAAGLHQEEIVDLMTKMEPCFQGHPRVIILIALLRSMAGMLGPASDQTRAGFLRELPGTIENILTKMDEALGRKSIYK
jgi:hypothetical protein